MTMTTTDLQPDQLRFNQRVTLKSDSAFTGYVLGMGSDLYDNGEHYKLVLVAVGKPGASAFRGNVWMRLDALTRP